MEYRIIDLLKFILNEMMHDNTVLMPIAIYLAIGLIFTPFFCWIMPHVHYSKKNDNFAYRVDVLVFEETANLMCFVWPLFAVIYIFEILIKLFLIVPYTFITKRLKERNEKKNRR